MNDKTKTPGAIVLGKGDTDPVGDCGNFAAGIKVDRWWQRILVYGNSAADAEALRDRVMAAINAEQPPAVGGEPVTLIVRHGPMGSDGLPEWVRAQTPSDAPYDIEHLTDGLELIDRAHVAPLLAELDALRKILAATREARDAAQYRVAELEATQGEPDAWMTESSEGTVFYACDPKPLLEGYEFSDQVEVCPLYRQAQPATAKVVLPERRELSQSTPYLSDLDHEWNACLDEVAKLNGGA